MSGPTFVRPGPAAVEPGQCSGGIILHHYAVPTQELLHVSHLIDVLGVEGQARADVELVHALWPGDVCLVFFDGDSGERVLPPEVE